jgi:hypothetical protein
MQGTEEEDEECLWHGEIKVRGSNTGQRRKQVKVRAG